MSSVAHVAPETKLEPELDLDVYFQRIGYAGPRTPTLSTLNAIVLHHAQTIARLLIGYNLCIRPVSIWRYHDVFAFV